MASRPARVLFHPYLFLAESWNGLDEHLLLLTRHLDRAEFEPSVLVHDSDGPQTRILADRASIRAVPAPYTATATVTARVRALARLYRAEHIDLVHLHSPVAGGQIVAALAARLARVRATVATYHQIQPWRLPARSRTINRLTHVGLVDHITAVSADVRATLGSAAGLPVRRIEVLHNGIEPADPDAGLVSGLPPRLPAEVRLGYFGRLSPEKGVDGLLLALAELRDSHPQVRTLIVGEGPQRASLEAFAARSAIAERVYFLGFRADARAIMREVDLVVHAPVYEGFGLVVAEAMAAGRPVVGNDAAGGVKEMIVDGETGLIAPAGSPAALARALARLVDDPAERQRMGQRGRQRFEAFFSAEGMSSRVATIYRRLLHSRA